MYTGDTGAKYELLVAIDLMERGYQVFRALSPSASCDLLVINPKGELERVEVKSLYLNKKGQMIYPRQSAGKFDILAGIFEGKIRYFPTIYEYPDK